MARNYAQGKFQMRYPEKYIGKGQPTYRSGWEMIFMQFCDNNPAILQWASEAISIPYRSPIDGKIKNYIPDFFVVYQNKHGHQIAEVVEIKPSGQSAITENQNGKERAIVAVNYAKWDAAQKWCQRQGLTFRVITEQDMFHNGRA